jgi:hypothetical protein
MALTMDEITKYGEKLISLLPSDGTSKGNMTLIEEFRKLLKKEFSYDISTDDYWNVRNYLINKGELVKARGKGGSVRLQNPIKEKVVISKIKKEADLYKPFIDYVQNLWVKDNEINNYIVQNTANQGKKYTGGKWTRPDITLITVKTYTFTPGRHLEVITFEIKNEGQYDVASVFETASHSVFAHKSYLSIACPNGEPDDEIFERIEDLCKEFGIGLLIFTDVEDESSYEELIEPKRKNPDPSKIDEFLQSQLNSDNQNRIHQMLK